MFTYRKVFIKKTGEQRVMNFVRFSELSMSDYETLSIPPPSGSKPRKYAEGNELVWDLDCNDYRVFNWNSVVEE